VLALATDAAMQVRVKDSHSRSFSVLLRQGFGGRSTPDRTFFRTISAGFGLNMACWFGD